MATLTTFTAGTVISSADVNANFAALNTEIAGASRTGYASAVTIGNVGTGADDLHAWTMPANTLTAVGDGLLIRTFFTFAGNANAKVVQLVLGTGTAITVNSTLAPSDKDLHVDLAVLVVSTTAAQNVVVRGTPVLCDTNSGTSAAFEAAVSAAVPAITGSLASPMVVKFKGTATATNDIRQSYCVISIFKAP